ncbi:long-chain fatty acid transport protein 4 isoform X2 [Ischnura elegans]|uniref:long-chain fatty acid transport protein 4 isoform X2 n=1 Tax=Ischnura elegans TaxID=197161 RepID=UPI001ED89E67|nr:long-chain fatty acid transport protein 4 isoform X2 [Ischnura elegans]
MGSIVQNGKKVPGLQSCGVVGNCDPESLSEKRPPSPLLAQIGLLRRAAFAMALLAAFCATALVLWYFMGWGSVAQLVVVALLAFILTGGRYRRLYVMIRTTPRDLKALFKLIRLRWRMHSYRKKNMSVAAMLRQKATKHPNQIAFIFENQEWTFGQIEEYSNQVAAAFKARGELKPGDAVALFMENRPEYVCLWLGLSKIGVITALVNHNLRRQPLTHSIKTAASKLLIYGIELEDAIQEVRDTLDTNLPIYRWCGSSSPKSEDTKDKEISNDKSQGQFIDLDSLISAASSAAPSAEDTFVGGFDDRLVYIYTSGTTGLPKAAIITNSRFFFLCVAIYELVGLHHTDRLYTSLPLYHTAGGICGIGQVFVNGCSMVLRRKFSASSYFKEAKKYHCTVGQYIGEMCRYMLSTPPHPDDKTHSIHTVFGNGLRPQIWSQFVERFGISHVGEFYGATEGNANIANIDDTVGAIGFISRIAPWIYPISIIRADPATGEPIRDKHGLCTVCKPGEPGVFVGKIIPNDPLRAFHGYVDKSASDKKVVRDVFRKGDAAFISGDILVMDELGYLYFKDRTGDTFRWKGENVSTSEVEAVISNEIGFRDAVAYGVEVTGLEGRAGMIAILDKENTLDLKMLHSGIQKALPAYARPIFIRVLPELDMTGTYKLKKVDLQKDGFNPAGIKDKLYYFTGSGGYEPLTQDIYDQIQSGKIRL